MQQKNRQEKTMDRVRRELLAEAQKQLGNNSPRLNQFKTSMTQFEQRVMSENRIGNTAAKESQIEQTYSSVQKIFAGAKEPLLGTDGKGIYTQEDRNKIAESLMGESANPRANVNQGVHNTCNVTTLREVELTINPAATAQRIASVSLTGQFTDPKGNSISVDRDSLRLDREAQSFFGPTKDNGLRSPAGQINDLALVSYKQQELTNKFLPQAVYTQDPSCPQQKPYFGILPGWTHAETGEHLRLGPISMGEGPDIKACDLATIAQNLHIGNNPVITNGNKPPMAGLENTRQVHNLTEFNQEVKKVLKTSPAVVMVHTTGSPQLFGDTGFNLQDGHVITINEQKQVSNEVRLKGSNQWGPVFDAKLDNVKATEVYAATLPQWLHSIGVNQNTQENQTQQTTKTVSGQLLQNASSGQIAVTDTRQINNKQSENTQENKESTNQQTTTDSNNSRNNKQQKGRGQKDDRGEEEGNKEDNEQQGGTNSNSRRRSSSNKQKQGNFQNQDAQGQSR